MFRPFFLLVAVLFSCNKPMHVDAPVDYADHFSGELGGWVSTFKDFRLADFRQGDSVHLYPGSNRPLSQVDSFLSIYRPILTFSPDSSQFLDIYSAQINLVKKGGYYQAYVDDAQEIFLYSARSRFWNYVTCGSLDLWIEEACWVSPTKFLLVCVEKEAKEKRHPLILLGDEGRQLIYRYVNTNPACVQTKYYESPKLKRMDIRGL